VSVAFFWDIQNSIYLNKTPHEILSGKKQEKQKKHDAILCCGVSDDYFSTVEMLGLDHHLDHRVGWVERSETQHFVFVGFRSSTQPTFHALAEIMIKAKC
jgi:hypothetical protein